MMTAEHLAIMLAGQSAFVVFAWMVAEVALRGRRRLLRLAILMAMASMMIGVFWSVAGTVLILTPGISPLGALVLVGGFTVVWLFLSMTWWLIAERDAGLSP